MTATIRDRYPRRVTVLEHVTIPLRDGVALAARVWLPDDAANDPVPAVLEYLPYRLNDGTWPGDDQQMRYFAGFGYAGVRVDIRGSGESDGILTDEYTPIEQADCLEVIAWLAAQPWCTGAVGMMGTSWSGFNSLQVAAHQPPALRAIASCYASDDRFADDVHYRGGLVLASDMLHWSVCMHGWQARPPDPAIVGERWRSMWRERLRQPPWVAHWLAHQRRDRYWQQGSVRDRYDAISCPVLCVAGWTDGYRDSALRLLEHLQVPRRAIIGPWGHNDPVHGTPGPAVGILGELTRWWDRWLKGVDNGVDREPALVAYMQDSVAPAANRETRPGRWVAEPTWPSPNVRAATWFLDRGSLDQTPTEEVSEASVASVQTLGVAGGVWCADGKSADLATDQRHDDADSLCCDSAPLGQPLEILGVATLRLVIHADQPLAMISARLCEVRDDGSSLLVTRSQLNLYHHYSHAEPRLLVPGEPISVTLAMDSIAHRFAAGSRIRVAISPCYWPFSWPSPEPVTLTIRYDADACLTLPVRARDAPDGLPRPLDEPEEPPPLATTLVRSGTPGTRRVTRDLATGRHDIEFVWDLGGLSELPNGILYEDTSTVTYSIHDNDPLSAQVRVANTSTFGRGDWRILIRADGTMTSTATTFLTTSTLEVFEDRQRVFAQTWTDEFPRDHC
jgi:uncharacterized protein